MNTEAGEGGGECCLKFLIAVTIASGAACLKAHKSTSTTMPTMMHRMLELSKGL